MALWITNTSYKNPSTKIQNIHLSESYRKLYFHNDSANGNVNSNNKKKLLELSLSAKPLNLLLL